MSNQSGYVYLLKNEAMPGIYKIGMTNRSVEERVKELSLSTSIPLPFEVVCSVSVENAKEIEEELHEQYEELRISNNREFFKFDDKKLEDVRGTFAHYSMNKIYDNVEEFDNAYGNDIENKIIDIAINHDLTKPFFLKDNDTGEYKNVLGSEILTLLLFSIKNKECVYAPIVSYKICTVDQYKQVLKKCISKDELKQCISNLNLTDKNDEFNLRDLLEE